jgi:hypothetical protein
MDWGLYNDTYRDPWSLTYAGQFWTCLKIGGVQSRKLTDTSMRVSPDPPTIQTLPPQEWVDFDGILSDFTQAMLFVHNLAGEFADAESMEWMVRADGLRNKWLKHGWEDMGPSRTNIIRRNDTLSVSDFRRRCADIVADNVKDIVDVFCRDGRTVPREPLYEYASKRFLGVAQ